MDLLKVLPEAEQLLGESAEVKLFTHGHTTHDRLDHPSVWNSFGGMVAFFGFQDAGKPDGYATDAPLVECTFLEALRDAWAHSYVLLVERVPVFHGFNLRQDFMQLMYYRRGWTPLVDGEQEKHLRRLREALAMAPFNLLSSRHTHG